MTTSAPARLGVPKVSAECHTAPRHPWTLHSRETPCHRRRQRPSAKRPPLLCWLPSLSWERALAQCWAAPTATRASTISASLPGPNFVFQHLRFSFPSHALPKMMLSGSCSWCAGEGSTWDLQCGDRRVCGRLRASAVGKGLCPATAVVSPGGGNKVTYLGGGELSLKSQCFFEHW